MAIDENDPRLKDMLRAIELGETLEDLDDPEDYDDMGGINSLKRKPPSIKMASEPEDEFELELGTVIKEYFDLKEQGIIRDISIEEYIDKYLSKKKMMKDRATAMGGGHMRMGFNEGGSDALKKEYKQDLEDGIISPDTTFNEWLDNNAPDPDMDLISKKKMMKDRATAMGGGMMRMGYAGGSEDIVEPSKSMQVDTTTYPLGQDPDNFPIKKEGSKIDLDIEMIKKLIEKRKKEKKKLAMGGIAGVL